MKFMRDLVLVSYGFDRLIGVDAWPRSEWGGKIVAVVVSLHLTTRRGDNSCVRRAPLEGPSWNVYSGVCVVRAELQVLSLLIKEGRSTFGIMARIWAKF